MAVISWIGFVAPRPTGKTMTRMTRKKHDTALRILDSSGNEPGIFRELPLGRSYHASRGSSSIISRRGERQLQCKAGSGFFCVIRVIAFPTGRGAQKPRLDKSNLRAHPTPNTRLGKGRWPAIQSICCTARSTCSSSRRSRGGRCTATASRAGSRTHRRRARDRGRAPSTRHSTASSAPGRSRPSGGSPRTTGRRSTTTSRRAGARSFAPRRRRGAQYSAAVFSVLDRRPERRGPGRALGPWPAPPCSACPGGRARVHARHRRRIPFHLDMRSPSSRAGAAAGRGAGARRSAASAT